MEIYGIMLSVIAEGQPDSIVQDIENMVRAFIEKVIILIYNEIIKKDGDAYGKIYLL